jgi:predicted nucleic acid-binding Zn ribbon protein
MRKNVTRPISEVISECLEDLKIGRTLKEKRMVSQWEELLGKAISSRTKYIYIKDRVLYVQMNSSVARSELLMMRQSILEKMNELAGEKLIDSVVIR